MGEEGVATENVPLRYVCANEREKRGSKWLGTIAAPTDSSVLADSAGRCSVNGVRQHMKNAVLVLECEMRSNFVLPAVLLMSFSFFVVGCATSGSAGEGGVTAMRSSATPTIVASRPAVPAPKPFVVVEGEIAESPEILKLVVALDFEDVEMTLRAELAQRNLNIVNVLNIQQALEGRGTEFPRYVVFQVCNLQDGLTLFHDHEDYGAFIPCSILMYEKDGKTVLVTRRPSAIVDRLMGHTPKEESIAVATRMEGELRAAMQSVADEARATN